MTGRALGLIGAPTSAGAFAPGQEDAPAAVRDAGIVARLREAEIEVIDLGDTPRVRWRPDRADPFAMNAEGVRAAALAVADKVATALKRDLMPLVIGGDCTVELGTVLGWQRHRDATALLYFDPHPDLNTPETAPDGAFDWMGMAHMLGEPGARRELVDLGGNAPALDARDVLVFGYSEARATVGERDAIARREIRVIQQADVARDPAAAAAQALEWAQERGPFLMHLDTDSIDFADLPLAENTDRNVGLSFDAVGAALDVLLASSELGALTITEINPHHGEPDGATLQLFLDRLVTALVRRCPRAVRSKSAPPNPALQSRPSAPGP
jgi:arginase